MDDEEYQARRAARRARRAQRAKEEAEREAVASPEPRTLSEPRSRQRRPQEAPRPIPANEAPAPREPASAAAMPPMEVPRDEPKVAASEDAPTSTGGASSWLFSLSKWTGFGSAPQEDDTQKKLAAMQKKIEAQQQKDELAQQKREESARKKEEALSRKEVLEKKREEMAQQRKRAALLKQQQRDAEKERRQKAKLESKEEAARAKQAKASEALLQAEAQQRQREVAEMDRKQRRLLSITPFQQRHPKMNHNLLNPVQRHMLLKVLVMMQMQREWLALGVPGTMGLYGFPFSSSAPSVQSAGWQQRLFRKQSIELPPMPPMPSDEPLILRHLFQVHLRHLPGLRDAPLDYWQKRIQSINEAFVNSNISTSRERGEIVLTHLLSLVATQYLGLFFVRGVGVRGQHELRGPGIGEPGSEKWGVGKGWGAGTVKRGLARPYVLTDEDYELVDSLFTGGDQQVWQAAGRESERIQSDWNAFKETIIELETGLEDMVGYLSVSHVGNLPVELQNAEEWVRIHVAKVLRWLFVVSPAADGLFHFVRIAHMLFPYWAVRQALMVTNAQTMVQLLLTILLAQPAGVDSLFQRIVSHSIGKEATSVQKEQIDPLLQEISEPMLVHKVEAYVRQRTVNETTRMHAESDRHGDDILTTILLSNQAPELDDAMQDHVLAMQAAFAASPYRTSLELALPPSMRKAQDPVSMPEWKASAHVQTQARTFALLKLLLRAMLAKHDRVHMAKLLSSSLFVGFLKESLTHVFYDGLRQVSKAADLGGRLGDLQKALDDMIELRNSSDNSEKEWCEWATRHHEFVYFFVHEMAPVLGPIWEWCQAALDFMSLSTSDAWHPDDRRAQNIEVNLDEILQDKRLTDDDVEHILEELNALIDYSRWSKIRREIEYRCMFVQTGAPDRSDAGRLSDKMRDAVQDPDKLLLSLRGRKADGRCDDVRGSERDQMPWAVFDVPDPLGQSIRAEPVSKYHCVHAPRTPVPGPSLAYTRKLQPLFRELLIAELPDWLDPDINGPPKPPPKQLAAVSKQLLRQTRAS
ncbi:hypothetical protein MCAP1_000116 [Malassezia caprae]|uniref:Uncharacterized protein n=1 Tax=Malassezia caprae TaxID=1381934 RepID=A0AAF0IY53_9BASI|nr:hypothetical protein MCAP1_000116 [Malassezia caprae]